MTESDRTLRVLVLDDDAMLRRAFERWGAVRQDVILETAATPSEARERVHAAAEPFDLVVCDFQLRALGPGETSESIVRELDGIGQRVLVMTADPDAARKVLGDLVPILTKPIALSELLAGARRRM